MLYPARLANPDAASIRTDCKNLSVCQHALRRVAPSRCVVRNADPVERESAVHSPGNEPESTASRPADSGDAVTYSYHSDGHYKATLEDVFKKSSNATLKVVAQKEHLSDADVESRLQTLVSLLPDIPARLPSMKPEIIARLLNDRQAVAHRLLALKQIFPGADCGKMLVKELGLMSEPIESLQQRAGALRDFLPTVDIDRLVQENPSVLSVESFKTAVADARRLMPQLNIESMMMSDPDFILSLQKGSDMIPYDAIPDNPWGHK